MARVGLVPHSPFPVPIFPCLRICGKCRAAFRPAACGASALPSPRSAIVRLPSAASSSRLHRHPRAVRLVSRHFPRLHEARWRGIIASPLRQRSLSRRKAAHPCADAGAWNGSEYLPRPLRLASAPVCAVPPLSGSPAPRLMRLARPRCSSRIPFPSLRRKRSACALHKPLQGVAHLWHR